MSNLRLASARFFATRLLAGGAAPVRRVLTCVALSLAATFAYTQPATGARIEVPEGFEVIPVALGPLVSFPMLGSFDDRGRLFVAENAGVNLDEKTLEEQLPSRIRMLEDTNGDGIFDRSVIYADRFAFPQGALWHDGALFVASAPGIWRLEDTNGDGQADSRRLIATGFKSTGNAADVHGPFIHPNGRVYWTHGRKGHEVYQNDSQNLVSKGLGARIWSANPDGSDIQVHAGGGMDNPVGLAFNEVGDVFGTANIFQGNPRNDAVVHWIHGGTYPRVDQESVLNEFKRTGDLLPPVTLIGHVAPSGIEFPRSGTWGDDYQNNLFYAEFNTRRLMRVPLERQGSTFRGHPQVFATAADPGVHFTDVIEDADGSLIVIDTGAWFRRGCPTSIVSRADIAGGIYRIRRIGQQGPVDPRGLSIAWDTLSPEQLVGHLGDRRHVVRDRAITTLVRQGESVVRSLDAALDHDDPTRRVNAVWALTRIGTSSARTAVRRALFDLNAQVRQVACQSVFVTRDHEAVEILVARLGDDVHAVQREAARALGRLGNPLAIPSLGGAASLPRDPVHAHAITYAMIEIDEPSQTRELLKHPDPLTRRAALIALGHSERGGLAAKDVFAELDSPHGSLRSAALGIAMRRPEWGATAVTYLETAVARPDRPHVRETVAQLIAAYLPSAEVRAWAATEIVESAKGRIAPLVLLAAIARTPSTWDESWRPFLIRMLKSADPAESQEALRAMGTHRSRDFSEALSAVGRDASRPSSFRVEALQMARGSDAPMDPALFAMLLEPLETGGTAEARLRAAGVLADTKLTGEQLLRLADVLPRVGPAELQRLLGAYQRGPADAPVGELLLEKLKISPGRWGVLQNTLQMIFQRYPEPAYENAAPMIAEIMGQYVARDGRLAELENLTANGDPIRGRAAYFAGAGACLTCHRVGETGGTLGPDLSQIGRIRTRRDLLEAIAFPEASIARGYEAFQVATQDGRTLTGTIQRETADTVFIVTADGVQNPIPRASISQLEAVSTSLMPAGLDRMMPPQELADLVAYLQSLQ